MRRPLTRIAAPSLVAFLAVMVSLAACEDPSNNSSTSSGGTSGGTFKAGPPSDSSVVPPGDAATTDSPTAPDANESSEVVSIANLPSGVLFGAASADGSAMLMTV